MTKRRSRSKQARPGWDLSQGLNVELTPLQQEIAGLLLIALALITLLGLFSASRGVVIDDAALIAALRGGKLAAAGLDVYNDEPDINPEYRTLSNVFLMPHIGSATSETRDAMGFRALDNLDAVFAGEEPRDRVA